MDGRNAQLPHKLLRQADLRITAPRLAVLSAVCEGEPHKDAEMITVAARERIGALSTQAVYDNLRVLVEAGLVRCIEPAGARALYESRVGDNHHHVICRACGIVRDVDCAVGKRPCMEACESHGYIIDEAEVIYWGICPDCQKRDR
jgi:Fur family ferric uptake transcriptional regulator